MKRMTSGFLTYIAVAVLWMILGNRVVLSAPSEDYCSRLERSGARVLPDYCDRRGEYSYAGLKIAAGLAVAGTAMLLIYNYEFDLPQESPRLPDDVMNPHYPKRPVDPADERMTSILSNPRYRTNLDSYNEIGLAYSLARDFSGLNVAVAVLDTGVAGTGAAPNPSYNSANPTWHGTAVANLVKTVAPDSEIIARRLTNDNGNFHTYSEIANHIAAAAESAAVINNSWGVSTKIGGLKNIDAGDMHGAGDMVDLLGRDFVDSVVSAARDRDVVFVWAAGNEGGSQSNAISALPIFYNEVAGNFINVVSYDAGTGMIADYSNHCGVTKFYCLTAPGTDMTLEIFKRHDADIPSEYVASGTSFAAPLVTGAVAAIKSAYPFMSGGDITRLLFATARDLGQPGVDDVYGRGMLDLEMASRPVGGLSVGDAPFGAAEISGDSILGASVARAGLRIMFTDSFGRGFNADMNDYISFSRKSKSLDVLKKFGDKKSNQISGRNIQNPFFLNDADVNMNTGHTFDFGGFSIGFDVVYQKYNFDRNPIHSDTNADSVSMIATLSFGATKFDFGIMNESGSILQSHISGEWLGTGKESTTAMFGARKDIDFGGNVSATIRANFGATNPDAADNSVISEISTIYTSAFSAELNVGDLSFAVARPLKVEHGTMDLVLPTSQNADGTLNYTRHKLSLQNNPAMEYGIDYRYGSMSFGAMYSDNELMLLFRIKQAI